MTSKWQIAGFAGGVTLGLCNAASAQTQVTVDVSRTHQTMYGFGATTLSLAYAATDNVPANLRTLAIQALYRDVHLNTGFLEIEPSEAPAANVFAPANDNDDPMVINSAGFNWIQSQNMHDLVVAPGTAYGFKDYFIGPVAGTGFALAWVNNYRASNYNRFLDEIAEHVVAVAMHWRDTYQTTPSLMMPFNEPTSGNGELAGGTPQMIADIVGRAGARIRAGGFADMRFVIPCEEREDISLNNARTVLADANARPYVGAIGYHPYPYGSTYAAVGNILATSGAGKPEAGKIAVRNQLRDLGAMYKVPVFMTEVSHSEKPFDDFDNVRGRAIHIHDELVYADAAAFFGMNSMWDSVSHAQHYMGRADPGFYSETDTIVLIDVAKGQVVISPMGRAIGHYARWLKRGAVRVDATSSDPLVLATGFVDSTLGRAVVVAINNASADQTLDVAISGVGLTGAVEGELSKAGSPWTPVSGVTATAGHIKYVLPTHAVVTLSATTVGGPVDAGVSTGAGGNANPTGAGGNANPTGAGGNANPTGAGGNATNPNGGAAGETNTGAGGATAGALSGGGAPASGGAENNLDSSTNSSSGCGCHVGSSDFSGRTARGFSLLAAALTLSRLRRRNRSRAIAALAVLALVPRPAIAQSPDGPLARYAGNPFLTKGPVGSYDQLKIGPRAILREGPNVWKMWYEAAQGGNQSTTGYATSSDGLNWTKYAGNPVMSPSVAWEGNGGANHENSPTAILKEDGVYKLWYHAISNTTRAIGYAESKDGLSWTKYAGNPVLSPGPMGAWDADTVCEPRVLRVGAQYYMFYTRCTGTHGMGLATSADGKSWTKYPGNPVLTIAAAGAWDSQQVSWGNVYYDGQRFYMWYPGKKSTDPAGFSLGLATSTDGKNWTRSTNNPVMVPPASPLGKGDDLGVESSPSLVRMGNTMRVYYGGFRSCCPEDTTVCLSTTPATGIANTAPVVDAGPDQTVSSRSATLTGTVMDDDTPVALASVLATWTKQSGPGTVTFANPNAVGTTASFSAPGTYVLALTASDTSLTGSDTVTIAVSASVLDAGGAESGAADASGTGADGSIGNAGGGGVGGQAGVGISMGSGGASAGAGGNGGTPGNAGIGGAEVNGGVGGRNGSAVADAGDTTISDSSSGCGCRIVGGSSRSTAMLLGIALSILATARRRPRRNN